MPTSASPTRKIAAIGAVVALVVALVAIGIAVGKAVEGGSDRTAGTPGAAASVSPQQDDDQQNLYDQLARQTSRRTDGDPLAVGRKDAPVVLVEYADYQCSFCGRFTRETQPELIKKFVDDGTLRIEFRNFTIYGADSERAARASWAAGQQGKFWQMHDELYAKTNKGSALAEDKLVEMARKSGVADLEKFRADLDSPAAAAALKKDQEEGYQLGVQSTPSFLVNGRPVAGAQPTAVFEQAVSQAAEQAKKSGGAGKGQGAGKAEEPAK
ncbi:MULTISPECIES: DsbA family protein [Streptomyces]|uniref:DsbA family protein n=2 Tax=Streptomyces rimosus subsp. rimosus TaxID=132474 RepID=L8EP13_STRR1|nr:MULTISPECIES: DsbA family protein [Streptomyces]KOG68015.1 DSBA oxidoreductase [Kitasatospora aureofaciens]MYT46390.1 thioredoxin domain-containing protein [Streptomyces sp. SID5471]KEF06480.1 DSBA oxidoreductase [Streptomyces rimosus]KEF21527.1 DSBA oxidoreductase [Streptomyces rimosus]KOT32837.1 DSBA oxidoreductase [Streptomyces rimosus subsp. rimosus]